MAMAMVSNFAVFDFVLLILEFPNKDAALVASFVFTERVANKSPNCHEGRATGISLPKGSYHKPCMHCLVATSSGCENFANYSSIVKTTSLTTLAYEIPSSPIAMSLPRS